MLDINLLVREGLIVLRKNYTLAIPTVVAVFMVSFISLAVAPTPEDPRKVVIAGIISMLFSLYAHGITLAMAREALEIGSTSLGTAAFIATRLSGTFFLAAGIVSLLVLAGSMMFLLPGIAAAFFLMFTFPSIVVDNVDAVEAIKRSITVTRMNLRDSAILFSLVMAMGLSFGILNVIISSIEVIGQLVGVAISGAFGGFISVLIIRTYKNFKKSAVLK